MSKKKQNKEKSLRELIIEAGFKDVENWNVFDHIQMRYFAKDGLLLFYNLPIQEYAPEAFMMGYGEMRCSKYHATAFRWVTDFEEVKKCYEAVTGKKLE